jgi:DnaA family protein
MDKLTQLPLAVSLPDDETFDSYLSKDNHVAVQQIRYFIAQPLPANPTALYVFGVKGVGKSHLLHASTGFAENFCKTSLCLSFSELKDLSIQAIENLENIDVVCLDDIHLIAGDLSWQTAIFDLFNRISEQGKQLIISGNLPVAELGFALPDLTSRLSWGHTVQLKGLSDEEKIIAIQYRAKQRGLVLQYEVAKFLLNRVAREMNYLLDCLDKLDKASIREQRKITIPFIKQVISAV